jgi:miniconductance mechanosensitive channel
MLSYIAHLIAKNFLLKTVTRFARSTSTSLDDILIDRNVFSRLAHIAPAFVVYGLSAVVFPEQKIIIEYTERFCLAYMVLIGALVVDALLGALVDLLESVKSLKDKPVKTYVQVVKIILYVVSSILILSILIERSPWALLSGLGAMTAIVMLVFKDSILGFVASIQLAAYDLIRVGDWIEFPKYSADGDITDISLNVVMVQNWDKTITTIPTHAFMSGSFKNWRGMSDSGGRRIKRSVAIDINSIKFCNEELIQRFRKIRVIEPYIDSKLSEIESYNQEISKDEAKYVNQRQLTNIGTFRAYIVHYIKSHPLIHPDMTLLVRQLAPTEKGLPIEIYCFSSDQNWNNYEDLQGDIFDHIFAVLPEFELRAFQNPSGKDIQSLAANS